MTELSDDLRALYQDVILDHGKHPRNFRAIDPADHKAVGHNPLCGDKLVLYVNQAPDGTITDLSFQGEGCAISTASASIMTDLLKGQPREKIEKLYTAFLARCTGEAADEASLTEDERDHLAVLSGVRAYPVRVKCATLAWHTLEAALADKSESTTE